VFLRLFEKMVSHDANGRTDTKRKENIFSIF